MSRQSAGPFPRPAPDTSRPAYFDVERDAWILSRRADVLSALRDVCLLAGDARLPAGDGRLPARHPRKTVAGDDPRPRSVDRTAAAGMRLEGRARRGEMVRTARACVAALPRDATIDLVTDFARPWALAVAGAMSGATGDVLAELADTARVVFMDAAHATSAEVAPEASAAIAEIAARLPPDGGALRVQAFVAVTQTLPHVLASTWLSLLDDPAAMRVLRNASRVGAAAVRELLRHAGPSRAVFRRAREDVDIGDAHIRAGDAVVLRLAAANRDPARFADPDRLDFDRTGTHLAFGHGAHACPGAALVRAAVAVTTEALLHGTRDVQPAGTPRWIDGFAVRAPASLPVRLPGRPRGADVPSTTGPTHVAAAVTRGRPPLRRPPPGSTFDVTGPSHPRGRSCQSASKPSSSTTTVPPPLTMR